MTSEIDHRELAEAFAEIIEQERAPAEVWLALCRLAEILRHPLAP